MSQPTYGAVAQRLISLNGTGGAFVNIYCISFCQQVEMMEDEASTPQGLQIESLIDNFATLNTFGAGDEPLYIPNIHRHSEGGALLGFPAQGLSSAFNYQAAPLVVMARSASATATVLRFTENA